MNRDFYFGPPETIEEDFAELGKINTDVSRLINEYGDLNTIYITSLQNGGVTHQELIAMQNRASSKYIELQQAMVNQFAKCKHLCISILDDGSAVGSRTLKSIPTSKVMSWRTTREYICGTHALFA